MAKQIKKIVMLLFVAATMFNFMSCSKDDEEAPANYPEKLNGTYYKMTSETDNLWSIVVRFAEKNNTCTFSYGEHDRGSSIYDGTFTYSEGKGTLNLRNKATDEPLTKTFTISGTVLTLTLNGTTYKLDKQ